MLFEKELIENIMPFAHAANALELPDGTLLVVWYAGAYEGAEDQRLAGAVRTPQGAWQPSHIVLDRFESEGEVWVPETAVPVLGQDGQLHLFFFAFPRSRFRLVQDVRTFFVKPQRAGFNCTPRRIEERLWYRDLLRTRLFRARLADFRATEIRPLPVRTEGLIIQGRALHLRDGRWMLPLHGRRGAEMRSAMVFASFLVGSPDLENWHLGPEIFTEPGCSEPAIVEIPGAELLCYMRRPGLTRTPPAPPGHIWRSTSTDGGSSFSAPEQTNLRNPDTGSDIYLGRGARLAIAFNDSYTERCPLSAGISDDLGKTWRMRDVESYLGAYAYPKLLQDREGLWHLFYSHNYAQIAHAWFDDAWLESGRQVLG